MSKPERQTHPTQWRVSSTPRSVSVALTRTSSILHAARCNCNVSAVSLTASSHPSHHLSPDNSDFENFRTSFNSNKEQSWRFRAVGYEISQQNVLRLQRSCNWGKCNLFEYWKQSVWLNSRAQYPISPRLTPSVTIISFQKFRVSLPKFEVSSDESAN